ncbi:MAG: M23 family metallopeptidase [Candidatus Krumholzibacteriota bacterium]|nr:M23 family metallopeptidase [Candidatus Krumholzibacteriota bacterium]
MTRPGGVQVFHLATMIFVLAAGASAGFASDSPPDLLWPLPIRPAVSSNFCEYREGHLHAGLDIRTFGKEGVPCRASGQGHISRIRASSNGYGKAVYVQLNTGETLVYAHLSEFAQPLEVAVREEQGRRRSYRVDMRFPPGRFPVDAGEVIGYSGMTGATAPHLHFEVRSTREHPLDPFSNGFTVLDELAPHFRALRLIPLDMDARIDGVCYPAEIQPVELEGARFVIRDTLALFGRVGVSVDVFDLLNDESGQLAPYMIELSVDGTTVSTVSFERFSFNHTSQVDFVYEIERIRSRKQYFFQLFRRAGETLWNRDFDSGGGTITPAPAPATSRSG